MKEEQMQTPIDVVARHRQEMAEQTAAAEAARKNNVATFEAMWLGLGSDVLRLAGTMHDGEIAQAKGAAMSRWNLLLGMEQQVERDEATLARRPKNRPSSSMDDTLPDRTIEKQDREWRAKTEYLRTSLEELKEQAKRERKELESFITKRR